MTNSPSREGFEKAVRGNYNLCRSARNPNEYAFATAKSAYFAWQACDQRWRDRLASEEMMEKIAELQANGWDYGSHPKDKAHIVLAAILKEME